MTRSFKIVENKKELEQVYRLRQQVFVKEDGYHPTHIKLNQDRAATHFLAFKDRKAIGAISVFVGRPQELPDIKYFNPLHFKSIKVAEIYKFAVIPEERGRLTSIGLMVLAYESAKRDEAEEIFISVLNTKKESIRIYKRFGFKVVAKGTAWGIGPGVAMILNLKDAPFEKDKEKSEFLKSLISRKLAKMIRQSI
jgi:predicted GNAT family N-acyltransferase